jgi:bacteriochlorophyll 4-vinyl reductase
MNDADVGRLLVASLHQAIADLIPTRLEFYEGWLSPAGLRDGRIGPGPLAAVLSFLRSEPEAYDIVAARAGEYAAEWLVHDLSAFERRLIGSLPTPIRVRVVMRLARAMVRRTYRSSRALVTWRRGAGAVDIRGSVFCAVRDPASHPLCAYYAAGIQRLMLLFGLDTQVLTQQCRATGAQQCHIAVAIRRSEAAVASTY